MSAIVHVVDYGIGNLYSVARAIEKIGAQACVTDDARSIAAADRVILPGVGAFKDGMEGLRAKGLDRVVMDYAASGKPLLGICLGMQLLASRSLEFGTHEGLGLLPGDVVPIPPTGADGAPHKVPFVGWAELRSHGDAGFANSALADLGRSQSVYLVHSYHLSPHDSADVLATYDYDGAAVTAAVARGNILGCQFHPEKSAAAGLEIIRRFALS